MTEQELGFSEDVKELIGADGLNVEDLGRVIVEHKERYIVQSFTTTLTAEITGNLRFAAESRADFPAVGDWVRIMPAVDETAVILEVFPRKTVLERQAVAKQSEKQIIAANIDFAVIVQSVGHDFNLHRLERYLTICHETGITPIILINKIDLVSNEEVEELLESIRERITDVEVLATIGFNESGIKSLINKLCKGKTYCFLGSSGVGKSTIINNLQGKSILKTSDISESTNKGKHTTSHRQMFFLPNGAIVIDTPGMRELGIVDQESGIEQTYDQIADLAEECKFKDCKHINEVGCAVLSALESGTLDQDVYGNYHKLKREERHYTSSVKEKREFFKKQGKMYKAILNEKKKKKY